MRYSRQKRYSTIWRRLGISLVVFGCCAVLSVGLLSLYYPGYQELRGIKRKIENVQRDIEQLERENKELVERIEKLRSPADNPLYMEKLARQNIGLVRDGETVYYLEHATGR